MSTSPTCVNAYKDDALGELDAVAVSALIKKGDISLSEVEAAAESRLNLINPLLNAVAYKAYKSPRRANDKSALLYGVPSLLKDNIDLAGMPTNHGTEALVARPAKRDCLYATQLLSTGVTLMGKSRMPEFGLNATTEFRSTPPTLNPWNTEYSVGASSGGAAAVVASGALPICHANDGGGSIRIPAAAAGLIGLKPSRGRHVDSKTARLLPINIISEGVLTRTVRDTAAYIAASEKFWRNPSMPKVGLVDGPSRRTLRVGLLMESVTDTVVDHETTAAVERTARVLESHGHVIEPIPIPAEASFGQDFVDYWALLASIAGGLGSFLFDSSFDKNLLDGLTQGLRERFRKGGWARTPGVLWRLRRARHIYEKCFNHIDLILSPVVSHTTPKIGYLSPNTPFDVLMSRLLNYVAFTPLQNVTGAPAISLPMGLGANGLPIGVQIAAAHGNDRTLLEIAFELENEAPRWRPARNNAEEKQ